MAKRYPKSDRKKKKVRMKYRDLRIREYQLIR